MSLSEGLALDATGVGDERLIFGIFDASPILSAGRFSFVVLKLKPVEGLKNYGYKRIFAILVFMAYILLGIDKVTCKY